MQQSNKKCQMPKHRARSCRGSRTAWVIWKENIGSEVNICGLGCLSFLFHRNVESSSFSFLLSFSRSDGVILVEYRKTICVFRISIARNILTFLYTICLAVALIANFHPVRLSFWLCCLLFAWFKRIMGNSYLSWFPFDTNIYASCKKSQDNKKNEAR